MNDVGELWTILAFDGTVAAELARHFVKTIRPGTSQRKTREFNEEVPDLRWRGGIRRTEIRGLRIPTEVVILKEGDSCVDSPLARTIVLVASPNRTSLKPAHCQDGRYQVVVGENLPQTRLPDMSNHLARLVFDLNSGRVIPMTVSPLNSV